LHQVGIPEWNAKQEYHENSFVNYNGVLYRCKTNNHTSVTDPASDTVNWEDVIGDNIVKLTDNQTINGIKTFSSNPLSTAPQSTNANALTKYSAVVKNSGNETIAGVKTFTSSPVVPAPTADFQAANKAYVDNNLSSIPAGVIVLWSGSSTSIPEGWALCDGLNGTPDLRDRFVIGAGGSYAVGSTGGSADAVVVSHTHTTPNHTHTGTAASAGAHTHTITRERDTGVSEGSQWGGGGGSNTAVTSSSSGAHTHSLTINSGGGGTSGSAGVSGVGKNLPPYYALAYIMKL
jgi:microcystin-dependent protein